MKNIILVAVLAIIATPHSFAQANWSVLPHVINNHLRSIHFCDDLNGYVTGDTSNIYKTDDGGLTWTNANPNFYSPYINAHYSGIFTTHPDSVYCAGSYGPYIAQSFDGGVTWDSIPTLANIFEVYFHNNIGFAHGNMMYRTINGGVTWTQISPTIWTAPGMTFVNDSCGYVPASSGA